MKPYFGASLYIPISYFGVKRLFTLFRRATAKSRPRVVLHLVAPPAVRPASTRERARHSGREDGVTDGRTDGRGGEGGRCFSLFPKPRLFIRAFRVSRTFFHRFQYIITFSRVDTLYYFRATFIPSCLSRFRVRSDRQRISRQFLNAGGRRAQLYIIQHN